jgi:predicted NBD/HSP70 family sugar kinase
MLKVLAIDVGGTHIKLLLRGEETHREFPSGPRMSASRMVTGVGAAAQGWAYQAVSINVGLRGLERAGKRRWRARVEDVVARLVAALEPEDVVLGGGNVKRLKTLPACCRAGNIAKAFVGGFELWRAPSQRGRQVDPPPRTPGRRAGRPGRP